jgi:hypothetical protein
MESTQLLNVLINVFYYIILITGVLVIGLLIYIGLFDNSLGFAIDSSMVSIMDKEYADSLSIKDYVGLMISILGMFLFIKTIYHLRTATLKMIHGEMFNHVVAKSLKLTGLSMIGYKVVSIIKDLYSESIYDGTFTVGLDFNGFESFIFILILGLFFILLSKVIKNGISMKSENDLTI